MIRVVILMLSLVSSLAFAELVITQATVRLLPPSVANTSAYFTVENKSNQDEFLISASSKVANKTELHNHVHQDGMMKMQQQAEVKIPAGQSVHFAPGGLHIMLFGLQHTLQEGQDVPLSLQTKSGANITFTAKVTNPSAHKHH
ncbi:copper chaperone PCu(A)C [Paraglaciecola aquimarina]|uniref:Copper chaperone PCu(A)C n=1 Tax=Paraglaciecola aquimarina TaxID=1235557 RepID=A0ABU3ST86_9ALTE|nr:copper chaperone PCu(A)C [Paraglaciecola aquimarina]MDU0353200.1 copper chaperone PCu(A)C [Paraglaciecola aquimarina]